MSAGVKGNRNGHPIRVLVRAGDDSSNLDLPAFVCWFQSRAIHGPYISPPRVLGPLAAQPSQVPDRLGISITAGPENGNVHLHLHLHIHWARAEKITTEYGESCNFSL